MEKLIEEIWRRASEESIDLESLGIHGEDDIVEYALKFMLNHLDDLDEEIDENSEDDELERILDDYPEISFVEGD